MNNVIPLHNDDARIERLWAEQDRLEAEIEPKVIRLRQITRELCELFGKVSDG